MKSGKIVKKAIQLAPVLMIALMAVIYFTALKDLTFEQILNYTPTAPLAAAAVILLMYALKSLSYFFPMLLIAAAAGAVLPRYAAIPVNLLGIVIMASIPYAVGKYAEGEVVDKLAAKHEKISIVREYSTKHQRFGAFFLRIVSCLPYDIVSLVMGSLRFNYKDYIIGSFLGTAPGIILTTFMGSAITEPLSPEFIICAVIEVIIAVSSAVAYRIHRKKQGKISGEGQE